MNQIRGHVRGDRPSRSFSWLTAMISAMPTVKPSITGSGTSAMKRPALTKPAGDEDDPGEQRREQQSVEAELRDDARDDDDECAGRTADLDPASAQQRNEEAADDRGDQPRFRRRSRRDRDRNAERQRDERDRDARHRVAEEQAPRIVFQRRQELGLHPPPLRGRDEAFNERVRAA